MLFWESWKSLLATDETHPEQQHSHRLPTSLPWPCWHRASCLLIFSHPACCSLVEQPRPRALGELETTVCREKWMEDGLCLSSHTDTISECVSQPSWFRPVFMNHHGYHSAAGGPSSTGVHSCSPPQAANLSSSRGPGLFHYDQLVLLFHPQSFSWQQQIIFLMVDKDSLLAGHQFVCGLLQNNIWKCLKCLNSLHLSSPLVRS